MRLKVEHRAYSRTFRQPLRTAHGFWSTREGVVLRVETSGGQVGFGEMAPVPGFGGGTTEEHVARLSALGSYVESEILQSAFSDGAGRFAVECALRGAGLFPRVPSLLRSAAVAALLPAGRKALEVLTDRLAVGFRTFKWKVGVEPAAEELALLDDLLALLPSGAKLRLDANGAWDRRTAERWLNRTAERPIDYVEQPARAASTDLLLGLAGDFPTPIALDESIANEADLQFWLGEGWPGVWVLKPALLGSPLDWVALLKKQNARVVFSSSVEGPVARRAALQLIFSLPGPVEPLGFGLGALFDDLLWDGPAPRPVLEESDWVVLRDEAVWECLR